MKQHNERLDLLLRQWKDIEPKASFETNVWRRIRLAQTEERERATVFELLFKRWLWQPAMAMAAAVVVSVVIGSSAGVLTARRPLAVANSELRFLSAGTLAGGYVKASTEGTR